MPTKPSIPTRRGGLLYAQGAHGALHLCCQVLVHTVTSSVTPRFQEIVATAMPNLAGAKGGCPGDVLLRPTGPSVLRSSEDLRSLLSWMQLLLLVRYTLAKPGGLGGWCGWYDSWYTWYTWLTRRSCSVRTRPAHCHSLSAQLLFFLLRRILAERAIKLFAHFVCGRERQS